VPAEPGETILLAHGGGGRLTQRLIRDLFGPAFRAALSNTDHDGATFELGGAKLAFTTDSFVVRPLFFPGGDIGSLAVNGTVNDLAMCGARPVALSAGFILEEGLSTDVLRKIAASMRRAADAAGVQLVTGDTKVVERGKGDGLYVNTSGIGVVEHGLPISPASVRPGDAIVLSGDVGRHGIAVMAVREGLRFDAEVESDCAPLWEPVRRLLDAGIGVHCLRDLTRGGLATALNEIAASSGTALRIDEIPIPVHPAVRGACEILGLDPLYVANEGRFLALVPETDAEKTLALLPGAVRIGRVEPGEPAVVLTTRIGTRRVLDLLSGEQLPRIC
jgi:hydrogenase expression/formation protein HypE